MYSTSVMVIFVNRLLTREMSVLVIAKSKGQSVLDMMSCYVK